MPLAFQSLSHGKIAFGFFNIESDMLLLEHYFFFATSFCENISSLAGSDDAAYASAWDVYSIENPEKIGNLTASIHGMSFEGFIGRLYEKYPFPPRPEDFKQNPEGFKTRRIVEEIIKPLGLRTKIDFRIDKKAAEAAIGEYVFSRPAFHELLDYVWLGGYPRWKEDIRPDYVTSMKKSVLESKNQVLEGCAFTG